MNKFISCQSISLFSIEIIGGGCRIPIIKKVITDLFEIPPCTSLDGNENIVRGLAIQALILNSE